jgi:hypothetical protein
VPSTLAFENDQTDAAEHGDCGEGEPQRDGLAEQDHPADADDDRNAELHGGGGQDSWVASQSFRARSIRVCQPGQDLADGHDAGARWVC